MTHRTYFKIPAFRSVDLRMAVAKLPCVRCGIEGHTQAAHIGGLAQGKGARIKVPDTHIAALCGPRIGVPGCHSLIGDGKEEGWQWVALTYIELTRAGLMKVAR